MGTSKHSCLALMGSAAEIGEADGGIVGHFHIIQGEVLSAVPSKLNALDHTSAMPDSL